MRKISWYRFWVWLWLKWPFERGGMWLVLRINKAYVKRIDDTIYTIEKRLDKE